MAMDNCINDHVADGSMDPARAKLAKDLYAEQQAALSASNGASEAERLAALAVKKQLRAQTSERHRQMLLQSAAVGEQTLRMTQFRTRRGEARPGKGLQAVMAHDELSPHPTTVSLHGAIRAEAHARMDQVLQTFHSTLLGRRPQMARLENIVAERFGKQTGDAAAREMAAAFGDAAEYLRLKFNQAGGHIAKLENWGLPQHHDQVLVRNAPRAEWVAFIRPKLDRTRMIDNLTGAPISEARLEIALNDMYESIASGGLNKSDANGVRAGASLGNRRADHRFLVFASPEDWLAYQRRFGAADPFVSMMKHIDGMSADIAMMQSFGPNPALGFRQLAQEAELQARALDRAAGTGGAHAGKASRDILLAQKMFDQLSGAAHVPVGSGRAAHIMQDVRHVLMAAQLEGAIIPAIFGDLAMSRLAANFAGARPLRVMRNYARLMNPANKADRAKMVRMRLIAEQFSADGLMSQRYLGEELRPGIAGRISEAVLRTSGLSAHTQNIRWAFGAELLGALADNAVLRFDELEAPLARTLQRYGIDAGRWDMLRATPMDDWRGAPMISAGNILAREDLSPRVRDDLATRLLNLVSAETEFAVPTSSLRGRAMLTAGRPGSLLQEVVKSGVMYKSFVVSVTLNHGQRMLVQPSVPGKLGYGIRLMVSMTLAGALSITLGDMLAGKDAPEPTPEFAARALSKGGGLLIYGDLLFPREDRGVADYAGALAGPVVGLVSDAGGLVLGNAGRAAAGEDTRVGADAVRLLDRYMPGGDLAYWKLAVDRYLFDNLRRMADPEAERKFQREERRLLRERGQRYWWPPGADAPERPPSLPGAR